jgi:hypothetical protein
MRKRYLITIWIINHTLWVTGVIFILVPHAHLFVATMLNILCFGHVLQQVSLESKRRIVMYTRKNAHVATNLQQTCSNAVPTTCQQDVFALLVPSLLTSCWQLATRLFSSTDSPAIQQFVNKLWVTILWQLDKITALFQLVDKLARSLLRTHLVNKLWDFYVCIWGLNWTIWSAAIELLFRFAIGINI